MKTTGYDPRLFQCHEQIARAIEVATERPANKPEERQNAPIVGGYVVKGSPEFAEWHQVAKKKS